MTVAPRPQQPDEAHWNERLNAEMERFGKLLGEASLAVWPRGVPSGQVNHKAYAPIHNAMGALGNIRTLMRLARATRPDAPSTQPDETVVCLECGWHIGPHGSCDCYEPRPDTPAAPPAQSDGDGPVDPATLSPEDRALLDHWRAGPGARPAQSVCDTEEET